jgi:hypothetical protein
MTSLRLVADEGLKYTANRPLLDGAATDRVDTLRQLAPRLVDFASWSSVYLELAQKAEVDEQWLDAATYYRPCGARRRGILMWPGAPGLGGGRGR